MDLMPQDMAHLSISIKLMIFSNTFSPIRVSIMMKTLTFLADSLEGKEKKAKALEDLAALVALVLKTMISFQKGSVTALEVSVQVHFRVHRLVVMAEYQNLRVP
jgi:hypothetical protein